MKCRHYFEEYEEKLQKVAFGGYKTFSEEIKNKKGIVTEIDTRTCPSKNETKQYETHVRERREAKKKEYQQKQSRNMLRKIKGNNKLKSAEVDAVTMFI